MEKTRTDKLLSALGSSWVWMRKHVDATLLIAAAVEIPRWCSTFAAINEPLYVGVPLGALLAYATSVAWKAYFENPKRKGLMWLNLAGLVIAIAVITPVLFALTESHEVKLTQVLLTELRWGWSGLLAITTFMPLIQLAAAKHATQVVVSDDSESPNMEPKITENSLNSVIVKVMDAQVVADDAQATLEEAHTDDAPTSESTQLDNVSIQIIDAIRSGATTPYAISKRTGIAQTTLKRKQGDMHIGRLPQLVAAGHLTNGGSDYRIANA